MPRVRDQDDLSVRRLYVIQLCCRRRRALGRRAASCRQWHFPRDDAGVAIDKLLHDAHTSAHQVHSVEEVLTEPDEIMAHIGTRQETPCTYSTGASNRTGHYSIVTLAAKWFSFSINECGFGIDSTTYLLKTLDKEVLHAHGNIWWKWRVQILHDVVQRRHRLQIVVRRVACTRRRRHIEARCSTRYPGNAKGMCKSIHGTGARYPVAIGADRPVSNSMAKQPTLQMSAAVVTALSSTTSGAIQYGVPTGEASLPALLSASSSPSFAATPKSASLTRPSLVVRILAPLISR